MSQPFYFTNKKHINEKVRPYALELFQGTLHSEATIEFHIETEKELDYWLHFISEAGAYPLFYHPHYIPVDRYLIKNIIHKERYAMFTDTIQKQVDEYNENVSSYKDVLMGVTFFYSKNNVLYKTTIMHPDVPEFEQPQDAFLLLAYETEGFKEFVEKEEEKNKEREKLKKQDQFRLFEESILKDPLLLLCETKGSMVFRVKQLAEQHHFDKVANMSHADLEGYIDLLIVKQRNK